MAFLLLAIVSLFLSAWITLVLHEVSHALAARLTNLQIREFRLGLGPISVETRLFGVQIKIGLVPIGGWVITFPQLFHSRPAMLLFFAAGPAMDLAWLVVLIALMGAYHGSDLAGALLVPAMIVQLTMLFRNLVPHYVKLYGERLPNDMLAWWKTVRGRSPDAVYRQNYLAALRPYMDPEEPSWQPSSRSDRIAFHLFGPGASLRHLTEEDIAALDRELALGVSRSEQLLIIDAIATHILAQQTSHHDAYLDRLTRKAVALAPQLATLKGTRGAALARLGQHDEALKVLAEADETTDFNRCLNAAFRALAHFHAGRRELAAAELDLSTAILQSQNWAGWIGCKIVDSVSAEIRCSSSAEHDMSKSAVEGDRYRNGRTAKHQ